VISPTIKRQTSSQLGVTGRLFLSLFFLAFFAGGMIFTGLIIRDVFRAAATYAWQRVECQILESRVADRRRSSDDSNPYRFEVKYSYSFRGQTFTSEQYRRRGGAFSDYSKAQRLADRFAPRSQSVCYVDPSNPSEAVLERQSLWMALTIPFPLIFVTIGAGGIYFTWRASRKSETDEEKKPISGPAAVAKGVWLLAAFFSIFLFVGLGVFYAMFLRPAAKILAARTWSETPCVVVSSQVSSHSSDDGTTYSVDILYGYTVNGREYKSNRYHFMGGSSSGYQGKAEIVSRHSPGTRTVCYVNPKDPTDAVLERGFTNDLWFGLLPLLFVAVGGGGVYFTLRAARRDRVISPAMKWLPKQARYGAGGAAPSLAVRGASTGPVVLKSTASPWAKFIGTIFIAAFWNGIVSVFVFQAVASWQRGRPEWFLTLFLIPFVLVGLVMIGAVVYFFLALFNPRATLTVNANAVPLGGTLELQWRLSGRVERVRRLRIYLEGREEATYRRGTTTSTDKEVFITVELANADMHNDIRGGQRKITVPSDTMHSFESDNNKIVWTLNVHGEIQRWPDVKEEFPVVVLPAPSQPPLRA
jgi:heme/copper-type cytochrome/quinol oxidase subunit 2